MARVLKKLGIKSTSSSVKTFRGRKIDTDQSPTDRQEKVEGFDQEKFENLTVTMVGAGGLGSEIGRALVSKGVGRLRILDGDRVEPSNLSRQFFYEKDLGEVKAVALAENLVKECTRGTELYAHPYHFQDALALGDELECDIAVCAPDNEKARKDVSKHYLNESPVVISALDYEATMGYAFVQEVGGRPCFKCFRPDSSGGDPCPGTPAVIDVAKTIASKVLFAIDSTVGGRKRSWNLWEESLPGFMPPRVERVQRREDCPVCEGEG